MAYVHEFCIDDELYYIDTDIVHITNSKLNDILKEVKNISKTHKNNKKWKYQELEKFFNKSTKSIMLLTFTEIENILGFKLCESAKKYKTYWYQKKEGSFANAWLRQGYEISKLNLEKGKITFRKSQKKSAKVNIPDILLTNKVPTNAKYELEEFFKYVCKKYGLSMK